MPFDRRPSDAERLGAIQRHAHDSLRYYATAALGGEDWMRAPPHLQCGEVATVAEIEGPDLLDGCRSAVDLDPRGANAAHGYEPSVRSACDWGLLR